MLEESKMVCCVAGDLQKVHASVVCYNGQGKISLGVGKEGKGNYN